MRLETKKYLHDMQRAASLVTRFTAGKTFGDYELDDMLRAAVEREFEIIGEAMSKLASIDQETAGRISGYQRIIGFRNILIHGYADVDNRLVWNVIETNFSTLTFDLGALLAVE